MMIFCAGSLVAALPAAFAGDQPAFTARDSFWHGFVENRSLNRQTNVANIVYTNKLSESTAIAIDATMRSGKDAANRTYNATGFTGYLTKTMSNENVLGLRAEYLTQNNATSGILPGYPTAPARKPTMNSITASYELSGAFPGARTLLEFRADRAGGALFPGDKVGTVKQDQTSVTFSQIFKI